MRIANLQGRVVLVRDSLALDVEHASNGKFGADPQGIYDVWDSFRSWEKTVDYREAHPFDAADLLAPVPSPRQVIAIGLNYRDHAEESNLAIPEHPVVFTKFVSSITGPSATVTLPAETVDWEVELVVVIGTEAKAIRAGDAWGHVAGLTVGQDLSERATQLRGPAPQFSLGKSFAGFSPIGPTVVTVDELAALGLDRDALRLQTELLGPDIEGTLSLQDGNTRDLIFSIPSLIERLSQVITFYPGDIIFTGTPAGVGQGRTPPVFLRPGQTLVSTIEGLGELRNALK